jgi:hypothetical protein
MAKTAGAVAVTDEEIQAILMMLGDGLTLMQACKKAKRSYSNVVRRISASSELKQLHAMGREEYMRAQVQKMHDIAKNPRIEPARARLMMDAIKWEAARVLPKEFGDRVQQEVIITNNTTLSTRMAAARARAGRKQVEQAIATQLPPATE